MSVLTRPDIIRGIEDGSIVVDPTPENIGPNSIDLRLHPGLKVYDIFPLDARADNPTRDLAIPEKGLILNPGLLYLGRTVERTYTPKHYPKLGGRSSTGRLGINVHVTAGFGDVGFNGTWTLEIFVIHPVKVYPNMRIAQLLLHDVSSPLDETEAYNGRYQGQVEATAYRGHLKDK